MDKNSHVLPLVVVLAGEKARVHAIRGANGDTQRLRELGLLEGRTIQVLRNDDPMICKIGNSRFGLCRRAANSILIERTEPCANQPH